MFKFKTMTSLLAVLAFLLPVGVVNAKKDEVQVATEYVVVGFSTTATNGMIVRDDSFNNLLGGRRAFDQICKDEVAPNARAATVADFLRAGPYPTAPPSHPHAWIQPGELDFVYIPNAENVLDTWEVHLKAYPKFFIGGQYVNQVVWKFECIDWDVSSSAFRGLVTTIKGDIKTESCDNVFPVACAAPVPIGGS
jgi:hypothetical protein